MTLFNAIDDALSHDLERLLVPMTFPHDTVLFRQGDPADYACVLDAGELDLGVRLPGGGQARLTRLSPGAVLGEIALVQDSSRSATARAVGDVRVRAIERTSFQSLLAFRHPLSFALLERIARLTAARIAHTNARLRTLLSIPDEAAHASTPASWHDNATPSATFDVSRFLPALAFFRSFSTRERDAFFDLTRTWTVPRDTVLFGEGDPAESAFLVIRGAASALIGPRAEHRVGVLGPGALFGTLGALLEQPRTATCRVREHATLLELPTHTFLDLLSSPDVHPASFATLTGLTHTLLARLTHTNRSLARLEQGQLTAACDLVPRRRQRSRKHPT